MALACASVAPHPAPGTAVRLQASSGPLAATITGVAGTYYGGDELSNAHIDVTDGSRTVISQPLVDGASYPSDASSTAPVVLASIGEDAEATAPPSTPGDVPLCLARFPGSSLPTVLVGLYSSGANCCTEIQIFTLPANTSTWRVLDDAVGDTAATVELVAGGPLIVTADSSFADRFTDFAGSGMPVVLQQVIGDTVVDVTRQHPTLVADDAAKWWRAYSQRPQDPLGALAAWTADECVLGHQSAAFSTLDRLQQQGKLEDSALEGASRSASASAGSAGAMGSAGSGPPSPAASTGIVGTLDWPQGSAYLSALRTFLVASAYCTAS